MSDSGELRKFVAPEFVFGVGARKLVGRYAANFGAHKVLVVTDAGVIVRRLAQFGSGIPQRGGTGI